MSGALLLPLLLRHRAHALTDPPLTLGSLLLAACDGGADRLAPDPRVSAAGAGDGHHDAPASHQHGGPKSCGCLGHAGCGERRESGPPVTSRKEGLVIGGLVELWSGPLQMPDASLERLLQQVVEFRPPPFFCGHLL